MAKKTTKMNLSFSTNINGKETLFVEKILEGMRLDKLITDEEYSNRLVQYMEAGHDCRPSVRPKIHTIREDKGERWKVGMDIHFIINNRSKDRLQFAPVLKVKSIQDIHIRNIFKETKFVKIDGELMDDNMILFLSRLDGFDSVEEFWEYFGGYDFKGKIIHWTEFDDYHCENITRVYDLKEGDEFKRSYMKKYRKVVKIHQLAGDHVRPIHRDKTLLCLEDCSQIICDGIEVIEIKEKSAE